MQSLMEIPAQVWMRRLPCGECLYDLGANCGMAGAAPCPILESCSWGRPSAFMYVDGRLVCSSFEPAFPAAEDGGFN